MSPELEAAISNAISSGAVNEQELLDCISRGYVRMKQSIAERAVDAGLTEAELAEVIAKRK